MCSDDGSSFKIRKLGECKIACVRMSDVQLRKSRGSFLMSASHPTTKVNSAKADIADGRSAVGGKAEVPGVGKRSAVGVKAEVTLDGWNFGSQPGTILPSANANFRFPTISEVRGPTV
jgi:hypothetical protein